MKIRALRLAEVGPFMEPVAVEGLSGSLDYFSGPNEAGKSTLFHALGVLLSERHTTTARGIVALRPDQGGAPLIEADVEIDGRLLRLTKRFLAHRMAQLIDLGSGQTWRGADAEVAADALFGSGERQALRSLLWVAQGASFALPEKPDAPLAAGLASLIEREAADASGAAQMRLLTSAVQVRLEQLVTVKQGKPKAGGPLDIARKNYDVIAERLRVQKEKAAAAAERLARWNALAAERDRLLDPEVKADLEAREISTREILAEADKARDRLRLATERIAAREMAFNQAKAGLAAYERRCQELASVMRALADGEAALDALRAARADCSAAVARRRGELEQSSITLRTEREALRRSQSAHARRAAKSRLAELEQRLSLACAADSIVASARGKLASCRVDEAGVAALRRLAAGLEALEARHAAEATRATISYLSGATQRVRIGGEALADGRSISIDRRTEIVIEGVGTIVLEPGASSGAETASDLDKGRRELGDLLAALGVANVEAAEAALSQRRRDENAAADSASRLAALAPEGLGHLEEAVAKVRHALGDTVVDDDAEPGDVQALESSVANLERQVDRCREMLAGSEQELKRLDTEIARNEADLAAGEKRRATLAAELPAEADREDTGVMLSDSARAAEGALSEAVRERSAWAEAVPDDARYDVMRSAAQRAAEDVLRQAERRIRTERELAELEGALRRDDEDGVGAEIVGLEEELASAARRLHEIKTDADALLLLASRLERLGEDQRQSVLRPLVDRLQPLLTRLFPDARLHMDGPLLAVRLERDQRQDPVQRVSGGTREQIATIVRIAYADLMAARGIEVPLVLDDALVFSDDQRLEIMVDLLAEAARRHQVIVLSCHQRALDPLLANLGARRLVLSSWSEASMPGGRSESVISRSRALNSASSLAS